MKKQMSLPLAVTIILFVLGLTLWGRYDLAKKGKLPVVSEEITSFADCKASGYPIIETYPEECVTPDGKQFANPDQALTFEEQSYNFYDATFVPEGTYYISIHRLIETDKGSVLVVEKELSADKDDFCAKNNTDCWEHQEMGEDPTPTLRSWYAFYVAPEATVSIMYAGEPGTYASPYFTAQVGEFISLLVSGAEIEGFYSYGLSDENNHLSEKAFYSYPVFEIKVKNGVVTSILQGYAE